MKATNIQWTHSTINPTSGCDGCELARRPPPNLTPEQYAKWLSEQECYALQVHERRWSKSLAITHPEMYAKHFFELRTITGRMAEAAAWGPVTDKEAATKPWFTTRRRHIFVSDMSDALSRDIPFDFLKKEIIDNATSEKGRRHVYQWLTKRPERMAEFDRWLESQDIEWPANLWAGTSVTSQRTAEVRVPSILKVRAKVRFLSCEPLFEGVDLSGKLCHWANDDGTGSWFTAVPGKRHQPLIHWVIVGGASGHDAAPFNLEWARSLIKQCRDAGVACFVKQLGAAPVDHHEETHVADTLIPACDFPLQLADSHGGDWSEWPEDLRVREIPEACA